MECVFFQLFWLGHKTLNLLILNLRPDTTVMGSHPERKVINSLRIHTEVVFFEGTSERSDDEILMINTICEQFITNMQRHFNIGVGVTLYSESPSFYNVCWSTAGQGRQHKYPLNKLREIAHDSSSLDWMSAWVSAFWSSDTRIVLLSRVPKHSFSAWATSLITMSNKNNAIHLFFSSSGGRVGHNSSWQR